MTLIDTAQRPGRTGVRNRPRRVRSAPRPARPAAGVLRYRGTAVAMSRAQHRSGSVSVPTTVAIAGLSALITVWLAVVGQSRAVDAVPAPAEHLAVVQVHSGESLQQLAGRMVPGAPVGQTVARIRELNGLESAAVDAGQTLITPIR